MHKLARSGAFGINIKGRHKKNGLAGTRPVGRGAQKYFLKNVFAFPDELDNLEALKKY